MRERDVDPFELKRVLPCQEKKVVPSHSVDTEDINRRKERGGATFILKRGTNSWKGKRIHCHRKGKRREGPSLEEGVGTTNL